MWTIYSDQAKIYSSPAPSTAVTEDGLPADADAVERRREAWDEGKTTRDRVYEVAIQLSDPGSAATVAERARCSADAARDHLDWFAEVGIVGRTEGRPATYRRNEAYFAWKRANELRERLDEEDRRERLDALTMEDREYRDRFDADAPGEVDAFEAASHAELHRVWEELAEWRTVRRELRLLERARRDARARDGLTA
jgi:hypothetical protein